MEEVPTVLQRNRTLLLVRKMCSSTRDFDLRLGTLDTGIWRSESSVMESGVSNVASAEDGKVSVTAELVEGTLVLSNA